ncbi:Uracil-DNA glycosylase, family 5 [Thioalkalivibrio nitratireducens DSM 14787]|uniref:Type-5 uracil-DNA glycosylase n=1 Tax=Thioalkalivibrio nitratireducens (strain DSM 14787 / UNIQEM 213 / ALEN2) TaxID=1255043 RepID=L0DVJ1_THIND|nr:Uracil-DNA glycosylase, family 5 [Thioalkalivibrio nitratireducens DSM 14787]
MTVPTVFDSACRRCPRLASHLDAVRVSHPDYHAAPVPPFGPERARLLIVGLAPGMHGANATGRPFTGDHAGILLYRTLHAFGFANRPEATGRDDGLALEDCRVTNAVKCLPPQNRPTPAEVRACNGFLGAEIDAVDPRIILALGRIAHDAVLRALDRPLRAHPFAHGAEHDVGSGRTLFDSYHCSRYNTQTRRLTPAMFEELFGEIRARLS